MLANAATTIGRHPWAVLGSAVAVVLLPAPARAHPVVEQAVEAYEQADFAGALQLFRQAEQREDLSRDDVVEMLLHRALVHHSRGDASEAEADLRRLVSLEPDHVLPPTMPPSFRELFDRIRGEAGEPVEVTVRAQGVADGVELHGRVRHDREGLVRHLVVWGRTAATPWRKVRNTSLRVDAAQGEAVDYYAEAIGPGGAAIANHGSADSPLRWTAMVDASRRDDPPARPDAGEATGISPWVWVGVAGAILAAGSVTTYLLLRDGGSDQTRLSRPMIEFP